MEENIVWWWMNWFVQIQLWKMVFCLACIVYLPCSVHSFLPVFIYIGIISRRIHLCESQRASDLPFQPLKSTPELLVSSDHASHLAAYGVPRQSENWTFRRLATWSFPYHPHPHPHHRHISPDQPLRWDLQHYIRVLLSIIIPSRVPIYSLGRGIVRPHSFRPRNELVAIVGSAGSGRVLKKSDTFDGPSYDIWHGMTCTAISLVTFVDSSCIGFDIFR